MFAASDRAGTTLLHGPRSLSKSFMFEAAIYWAEEGRRVVYVTPSPLDRLPAGCHERTNPAAAAFRLMRFMYLENYEALVERLVELHTYASLPSVLLIDDFDAYIDDCKNTDAPEKEHIARACSLILDTMNSCARILKTSVYICVWSSSSFLSNPTTYAMYFRNIWNATEEHGEQMDAGAIWLKKYSRGSSSTENYPSFKYQRLEDGTRVLREVLQESA